MDQERERPDAAGDPRTHSDSRERLLMTNNDKTDDVRRQLLEWRNSIDNIDAALIHLLAERFKCTQKVGEFKAKHGLPPADPGREAEQIARLRALAKSARLDPDFAEEFLAFVIKEVIRHHEIIKNGAA